jgi:hypothetical protein
MTGGGGGERQASMYLLMVDGVLGKMGMELN